MLDDLDRELWQRGHRFVRYADDVRVFVRSERAAHRVLSSVAKVIEERLKLKVNQDKSSVRPAPKATLLGFGFFCSKSEVRIRVDPKALLRLKRRLRQLTRRNWRVSMGRRIEELNRFILGWMGYFRLIGTPSVFRRVDAWLHRRLRQVHWKEWKLPKRRVRALKALGIPATEAHQWGVSSRGHWRMARSTALSVALPGAYWDNLGLHRLFQLWQRFNQAA